MSDWDGLDIKQLREALCNEELPALRDAGLLPESRIDYLETYRENYEPHQAPHYETGEPAYWYYNSKQYVSVVRRSVGKTLSKAVRNGKSALIKHALGLADSSGPEMDFVDYEVFRELIAEPSLQLLIFGDTGSGKSFTGLRILELGRMVTGATLLTNIESVAEGNKGVEYVASYVGLLWYCINNPDKRKFILADELSNLMSGYAADKYEVETYMRPLVRKMRKEPFKLSLIGIGHRPKDIHPTLRNGELSYFAFKTGRTKEAAQKHMKVYSELSGSEEAGNEDKVKCDIRGIGLPSLDIDTNDGGNWHWGREDEILEAAYALRDAGYGDMLGLIRNLEDEEDDELGEVKSVDEDAVRLREREEMCLQMHENGKSYGQIHKDTGIPQSTVGDMVRRARDRAESTD